jgi:hypothetical protein
MVGDMHTKDPARPRRSPWHRVVQRLKGLAIGVSETLLAVGLVLVFFLIFTGILIASLPQGTELTSFYASLVRGERGERGGVDVALEDKGRLFIAELTGATRKVKDRAENAVAWSDSRPGISLGNNHAIQTLSRSEAVIAFEDENELQLGENSLVVLRQETGPYNWLARRASLVVLGGEVQGRLAAVREEAMPLEIVAGGATARLDGTDGKPAEFRVTAKDDEKATLKVFSGSAAVRMGDEVAVVRPDEALTLHAGKPLGEARRIPDAPRPLAPADGEVRVFGATAPEVTLRWSDPGGVDAYRLVVARDAGVEQVVVEDTLADPEFDFASLAPGSYYWRVSGLSDGIESEPSAVYVFRLSRDLEPPRLRVDLPALSVNADRLVVRGATEPGARILIGRTAVATTEAGEFEHTLRLRPGPNLIVVEAVDTHGNAAYFSEYVNAKFVAPEDRP